MRTGVYQHIVCCIVYLRKMIPHTIETFFEWQIHWTFPHFLCARLDFLLTSFVCSLLRVQLQSSYSIIFSCLLILGYAVCISHTTDAKYVSHWLTQITKRQCKPWTLEIWCQLDHHCLNFLVWYFHYLTMNINVQGCIYKLTLTEQMYGPPGMNTTHPLLATAIGHISGMSTCFDTTQLTGC